VGGVWYHPSMKSKGWSNFEWEGEKRERCKTQKYRTAKGLRDNMFSNKGGGVGSSLTFLGEHVWQARGSSQEKGGQGKKKPVFNLFKKEKRGRTQGITILGNRVIDRKVE